MQANTQPQRIQVGTRVYSGLYGGRHGTVFQIDGEQSPEAVRPIFGGCGTTGGNAHISVVFDNGSYAKQVHESTIRGVQWRISNVVETAAQIAARIAHADSVIAQLQADKAAADAAFAAEVERLKTAEECQHLTPGDDVHSGTLAASNMRKALKARWPKVKFGVRKRSYGVVMVSWQDGPTPTAVENLLKPFQGGRFDGMDDCRSFEKTPFIVVFGGCDSLSTYRKESDELVAKAIDNLWQRYPANFADIARPVVDDFNQGRLMNVSGGGLGRDLQHLVRQELGQLEG